MQGEIWCIRGIDFYRWVLKDTRTMNLFRRNIDERFQLITKNEENRHDEFKFHNIDAPEVDSLLDDVSERYVSSDEEIKK